MKNMTRVCGMVGREGAASPCAAELVNHATALVQTGWYASMSSQCAKLLAEEGEGAGAFALTNGVALLTESYKMLIASSFDFSCMFCNSGYRACKQQAQTTSCEPPSPPLHLPPPPAICHPSPTS